MRKIWLGGLLALAACSSSGSSSTSTGTSSAGSSGSSSTGTSSGSGSTGTSSSSSSGGSSGSSNLTGRDGTYSCPATGQNGIGDSCSGAWFEKFFTWTIDVSDATVTLTSGGFDADHYQCSGQWAGTTFTCALSWSRSGRACTGTVELDQAGNGALVFKMVGWGGSAACTQ